MSNTIDFEKQDKEYIANTYGRFNVCFEKGKGSLLWDVDGKEYIDLGSGIGVTAFGVDDDEWTEAVTKQSHALNHISNLYYSLPQIELAKQLCTKTGMKKVFFSNSGAESNECAIKAARKYSHDKYGEGRHVIVTLVNSSIRMACGISPLMMNTFCAPASMASKQQSTFGIIPPAIIPSAFN